MRWKWNFPLNLVQRGRGRQWRRQKSLHHYISKSQNTVFVVLTKNSRYLFHKMMYLHIFIPVFCMNMVKYINSHNKNSFSSRYHTPHLVFLCFKANVFKAAKIHHCRNIFKASYKAPVIPKFTVTTFSGLKSEW
jgi:hypothetical protein